MLDEQLNADIDRMESALELARTCGEPVSANTAARLQLLGEACTRIALKALLSSSVVVLTEDKEFDDGSTGG